jgi:gamma-glutamyl phosphate reductase
VQVAGEVLQVVAEQVDPIEGVEDRPYRPADRNVETVRFPVEVVADRPEEIIEIRYVVA